MQTRASPSQQTAGLSAIELLLLVVILSVMGFLVFRLAVRPHGERPSTGSAQDQKAPGVSETDRSQPAKARRSAFSGRPQPTRALRDTREPDTPVSYLGSSSREADDLNFAVMSTLRDAAYAGALPGPEWVEKLSGLDAMDLREAWELLGQVPWSTDREEIQKSVMASWARIDPEGAIRFIEKSVTSARLRRKALTAITDAWAETNPFGALAWYMARGGEGDAASSLRVPGALRGAYATDPASALDILWQLPSDRIQKRALRSLFFGDESPANRDALLALFDQSPPGDERNLLVEVLTHHWGHEDPAGVSEWLEGLTDVKARDTAIVELARVWTRVAPHEVAGWLTSLQRPDLEPELASRLAKGWVHDDRDAFLAWLDSQPPGPVRTSALQNASAAILTRDPALSMQLAAQMPEGEERTRQMKRAGQTWFRKDPQAALPYILDSDLPETVKQQYLNRAEQNRQDNP